MKFNLAMVQINVTNIENAEKFYCEKLGFEKDTEKSLDGVLLLESDGPLPILIYPTAKKNISTYGENSGPILVIQVEDIYATHKQWLEKGVEFIPAPWSEDDTGIAGCPFGLFIAFKDPDGNTHEILQPH